jgi:hypothetical protein
MINSVYEEIIKPENIKAFFVSDNEFESWLETGTKQDLICTLQAFENAEMYEDCAIIKNKIDEYK